MRTEYMYIYVIKVCDWFGLEDLRSIWISRNSLREYAQVIPNSPCLFLGSGGGGLCLENVVVYINKIPQSHQQDRPQTENSPEKEQKITLPRTATNRSVWSHLWWWVGFCGKLKQHKKRVLFNVYCDGCSYSPLLAFLYFRTGFASCGRPNSCLYSDVFVVFSWS